MLLTASVHQQCSVLSGRVCPYADVCITKNPYKTTAADCGCVIDCGDYRLCCVWVTLTSMFSFLLLKKTAEVWPFSETPVFLKFVFMAKFVPILTHK